MITLSQYERTPLYQQIYNQIRDHIISGAFAAGSKLPPIRKLAEDLEISRNTVEAAYLQLSQEGYVSSRTGSGFVVEQLDLSYDLSGANLQEASDTFAQRLAQTSLWPGQNEAGAANSDSRNYTGPNNAESEDGFAATGEEPGNLPPVLFDFTYGNLQAGAFPAQLWKRLTNEILSTTDAWKASAYTDPLGERKLREQITMQLHVTSGVNCHPAQVVLQPGTQASLQNLLMLFDPLRDVIGMEEPGYDGVRAVFENNRFRLFPLPVYRGHDAFVDSLYASHARLCYVTPSNQFPTGAVLPLGVRQRLLKWASEENAYIIEDDYCREFRYTVRPLPSLQSLDRNSRVIYMGTFSKALSPALRMNYLVLPPDLLFEWHKRFEKYYPQVPWLNQAVLAEYIDGGYWDRQLRKTQATNKRKYHLLISALHKYMGDRIVILENGSGLHLLVGAADERHQNTLIAQARAAGVVVYGTNRYWMSEQHPMENFVLVGFSAIDEKRIEQGIRTLAAAWFS
ncbi:MAG: PLP-dependent aminotransferase family protein [Coriobacteriales bacterium]|jgi:GntR family transcriptional regulator/MocR family aminotransferase|nr:PLP-dependent aminotransferase family protein [Coriobacteriales bacterium]